jgi:hypothetical protein
MPTPGLWSATWLPDAPKGRIGGDRIPYIRARGEAQPRGGRGRISRSRRARGGASSCPSRLVQTLASGHELEGRDRDVSMATHAPTYLSPRVRGPVPSPEPGWSGVVDATGPRPSLISRRVALAGARLAVRSVGGVAVLSVVLAGWFALLRAWPRSRPRLASVLRASCSPVTESEWVEGSFLPGVLSCPRPCVRAG